MNNANAEELGRIAANAVLFSPRAVWDKHRKSAECVESREYERIDNDNSANQAYPINSENNGKYLY